MDGDDHRSRETRDIDDRSRDSSPESARTGGRTPTEGSNPADERELEDVVAEEEATQDTGPDTETTGGRDLPPPLEEIGIESTTVGIEADGDVIERPPVRPTGRRSWDFWNIETLSVSISSRSTQVHTPLQPQASTATPLEISTPDFSLSVAQNPVTDRCTLRGQSVMRVTTPERVNLVQDHHMTDAQQDTARNSSTETDLTEIFEFELWDSESGDGSVSLNRRRPQVIVHEQPVDEPDSFEFLCRVLRDYYTFIEGGKPTVKPVEFISNQVRIPSLSHKILRLDMTGDEWELDTGADRVHTRRNNSDIFPKLAKVTRAQFAGALGFLVINVPETAGQNVFVSDSISTVLANQLRKELRDGTDEPTTVAHVTPSETRADWGRIMAEYLGFSGSEDSSVAGLEDSSVAGLEDRFWRCIESPDWHSVALTERQTSTGDGESDHHFLFKSSLANAVGQLAYESRETDSTESYDEYFDDVVTDHIDTEHDIDSGGSADVHVDIEGWDNLSPEVLESFVTGDIDWSDIDSLVFEFETGRSEGAFAFRKIRESLEKYEGGSTDLVAIVVPSWLVEIDQISTRTVKQLVDQWNRSNNDHVSALFVPTFGSAGCSELKLVAGGSTDD